MKRTTAERELMQAESLSRATAGRSKNDALIVAGFAARGIVAHPRRDSFTYNAWQALGRQVRKGEHGVKCCVIVKVTKKAETPDKKDKTFSMRKPAPVFHISQTDLVNPDKFARGMQAIEEQARDFDPDDCEGDEE